MPDQIDPGKAAMREILLRAGVRTLIVRKRFSSVPQEITFDAVPIDGGAEASGHIEVIGSSWLSPKSPVVTALGRHNTIRKGFWDTFFAVYVTPDRDTAVLIHRGSLPPISWIAAAAVVVAALAVFGVTLMR